MDNNREQIESRATAIEAERIEEIDELLDDVEIDILKALNRLCNSGQYVTEHFSGEISKLSEAIDMLKIDREMME